jgi:hypothetical protein
MTRPSRVGIIHLGLAIFVVALLVKTAKVQLFEGKHFAAIGVHQQSTERMIPAPRGNILDSRGQTLAQMAIDRPEVKGNIVKNEVRILVGEDKLAHLIRVNQTAGRPAGAG